MSLVGCLAIVHLNVNDTVTVTETGSPRSRYNFCDIIDGLNDLLTCQARCCSALEALNSLSDKISELGVGPEITAPNDWAPRVRCLLHPSANSLYTFSVNSVTQHAGDPCAGDGGDNGGWRDEYASVTGWTGTGVNPNNCS